MDIQTYRNLWGYPGPRERAVVEIEEAGYDGIEAVLFSAEEHTLLRKAMRGRSIPFRGVILNGDGGTSVADQLRTFTAKLTAYARMGATSVNAISGYDCWSADEAARFYESALKVAEKTGLPVSHETHRNSALFHPSVARRVIERFPELSLTCDFSHWVVACERLIEDQADLIRLCGSRATHIHTRVGNEQSPQLSDVRAPEAGPYLAAFERWWEIVWEEQAARGLPTTVVCPEFGPPPYQQTLPHTGMPVADLKAVCDWQRERQMAHFAAWSVQRRGRPRTRS